MFHDDDNIGDDEYDDLMESAQMSFARDVVATLKKNKDNSIKEVGDIVLVWDTSRMTDVDTGEVNTDILDHQIMATYPSIVVGENLTYNADIVLGEDRVYPCNLDLIVWNKTLGKKFRTASKFTKITKDKV